MLPRFSLALGADVGAIGNRLLLSAMVAPSFTVGSLHFGERKEHELGLTDTVMWWPTNAFLGGYGLVRYTYFF